MSIRFRRGHRLLGGGFLVVALLIGACQGGHPTDTSQSAQVPRGTHTAGPTRPPKAGHPHRTPTPTKRPVAPPSPTATVPPSPSTGALVALLDQLRRQPRPQGTEGYHRDAFGDDWIDTDGNGCNQRDDVLLRDAVPGTVVVARQDSCNHDVLAGTWHDPYTGRMLHFTDLKDLHQAMAIQIDHIVPLAEAWVSGARTWSDDRRRAFANDLPELLAVDGPTNQSKGDGDPAAWRPRKGFQCTYAARWIRTKHRWDLAVDDSEVRALREMLAYC